MFVSQAYQKLCDKLEKKSLSQQTRTSLIRVAAVRVAIFTAQTDLLRRRALVCVCLCTLRLESAAVCGSISKSSIHITIQFPSEFLCGLGTSGINAFVGEKSFFLQMIWGLVDSFLNSMVFCSCVTHVMIQGNPREPDIFKITDIFKINSTQLFFK